MLSSVGAYRKTIREFAAVRDVDVWCAAQPERPRAVPPEVSSRTARRYDKAVAKAQRKNSLRAFAKLTSRDGDRIRIVSDPPLIVPVEELVEAGQPQIVKRLEKLLAAYRDTLAPDIRRLGRAIGTCTPPTGGRGRQRRHPRLDSPPPRPRLPGPALPPG